MLDFLMRQGEVAIVGREGRHKRWDLAERVYPADLPEYDDEEATRLLAETAAAGRRHREAEIAVDAGRRGG